MWARRCNLIHVFMVTSGAFAQVHSAVSRKTREKVSIFILNKDELPKGLKTETFYAAVRKGVTQLTRLKHPALLQPLHPLDESRSAFVMVNANLQCSAFGCVEMNVVCRSPVPLYARCPTH